MSVDCKTYLYLQHKFSANYPKKKFCILGEPPQLPRGNATCERARLMLIEVPTVTIVTHVSFQFFPSTVLRLPIEIEGANYTAVRADALRNNDGY